jgi:hypothetical protein
LNLVFPYAGHSVMLTPCGAQVIESFLVAGGELDAVDTSCLDTLEPPAW